MFETVSFAKRDPAFARLNPSIDSGAIYGYQSEALGQFQGFISSDTKYTFNFLTASTWFLLKKKSFLKEMITN